MVQRKCLTADADPERTGSVQFFVWHGSQNLCQTITELWLLALSANVTLWQRRGEVDCDWDDRVSLASVVRIFSWTGFNHEQILIETGTHSFVRVPSDLFHSLITPFLVMLHRRINHSSTIVPERCICVFDRTVCWKCITSLICIDVIKTPDI